jgi:hypothetical protein
MKLKKSKKTFGYALALFDYKTSSVYYYSRPLVFSHPRFAISSTKAIDGINIFNNPAECHNKLLPKRFRKGKVRFICKCEYSINHHARKSFVRFTRLHPFQGMHALTRL